MSKSNPNRPTALAPMRHQPFTALRYFLMAHAGSGCADRLEIGELDQGLDPIDTQSTGINAPVIVDGPEDADAILLPTASDPVPPDRLQMVHGVGDVDGDGYGDWLSDYQLTYGRPRPADGVLIARL